MNLQDTAVYLGLGSNLGDRLNNLRQAVSALNAFAHIQRVSPVYQTPPWGISDQPDFLNLCLSASTSLAPLPLLDKIKTLESVLGRQSTRHWGPRLIDIDILFYNRLTLISQRLTIPHPHIAERVFVLAPLADVAPTFSHPQTGLTVSEMLSAIDASDIIKLPNPLFEDESFQ